MVGRDLHPIPLEDALNRLWKPRTCVITMSEGQWDALLATAYEEGWILLEVNDKEFPVRAYQKVTP